MGLTTEEQQLVLKVTGQQDVERLTAELHKEEAAIRALADAKKAGTITDAQYAAGMQAAAAAATKHTAAIEATRTATRGYGQNMTALGYAMNDFFSVSGSLPQRLNAIANNLPGVFAGFGAFGLVLSGLVPVIGMLLPQLEKLWASLGDAAALDAAKTGIQRLEAQLKELSSKEHKTSIEVVGLDNARKELTQLKQDISAFEALGQMRKADQERSGAAVQAVLKESEAPAVQKKLKDAMVERLAAGDPEIKKANKEAEEADAAAKQFRGMGGTHEIAAASAEAMAEAARERAKLRKATIAQADGIAETTVGGALNAAKGGNVTPLAGQLKDAGLGDLSEKIADASPEKIKERDAARQAIGGAISANVVPFFNRIGREVEMNRTLGKAEQEMKAERDQAKFDAMTGKGAGKGKGAGTGKGRPALADGIDGPAAVSEDDGPEAGDLEGLKDTTRRKFNPNTPRGRRETAMMKRRRLQESRVETGGEATPPGPNAGAPLGGAAIGDAATAGASASAHDTAIRRTPRNQRRIDAARAKRERQAAANRAAKAGKSRGMRALMDRDAPTDRSQDPNASLRQVKEPGQAGGQGKPGGLAQDLQHQNAALMRLLQEQNAQIEAARAAAASGTQGIQNLGMQFENRMQAQQTTSYSHAPAWW